MSNVSGFVGEGTLFVFCFVFLFYFSVQFCFHIYCSNIWNLYDIIMLIRCVFKEVRTNQLRQHLLSTQIVSCNCFSIISSIPTIFLTSPIPSFKYFPIVFVSQIPIHFASFLLNTQNCFNSPFQILSHMAEIKI